MPEIIVRKYIFLNANVYWAFKHLIKYKIKECIAHTPQFYSVAQTEQKYAIAFADVYIGKKPDLILMLVN